MNANTDIYDKSIDRSAMIRLYERRLNGKVELTLNGHRVKVDKLIRKANLSHKGFIALREAIDQQLQKTFKGIYRETSTSLISLMKDQMSYTYQSIDNTIGQIWKTERPNRMVAENIVLNKPLHADRTLLEGWAGVSLGERKRLESVIRQGIAEGKTVDQIALMVRRGNIHNITMMQSKALVITATTSVHAQADQLVYAANEKSIVGWQYVAVLDSRTTPICSHRDGTIYPVGDTRHLPPAHFRCRSTTIPVFKSWSDIANLEGVANVRRRNIRNLTPSQVAYYDGLSPAKESYDTWLRRQPTDIQLRHLGDYNKVEIFRRGELTIDKFTNDEGNSIGLRELRQLSLPVVPSDTKKFAIAKEKLDAMQLGATSPEDFLVDVKLRKTLKDYYLLQAGELDGTLSTINYRGALIHTKQAQRRRVLTSPPREDQLVFNPVTRRYEDVRMYQPNYYVFSNSRRLVDEDLILLDRDKVFINKFVDDLSEQLGVNERAVISDNLRIIFTRYRKNPEPWVNFKAVTQSQIKFDVMNISDAIETQIRKDSDILKKLTQDNFIDPVLGAIQLDDLHDNFIDNIFAKNKWEDTMAPVIANELRGMPTFLGKYSDLLTPKKYKEIRGAFDTAILKHNPILWKRLDEGSLQQFYLRMAHRLGLADTPDRDQLAVALGRDLYNLGGLNGDRYKWYELGLDLINDEHSRKFFEIETFGVQKRRLKSRMSGNYFGPYYDTVSYNIRVTDLRIQEYSKLTRKVEVGLRVSVTDEKNKLYFREGYKTYFAKRNGMYLNTRIPITSTHSFSDFPTEFVDKDLVDALNWASMAEYKIDHDFYDFTRKLLYFEDDRGRAKYFNDLNEYRKYMASRGDLYERYKSMEWLDAGDKAFSNHAFIDHRARVYDRGMISPQSGETFRPFLNTAKVENFSKAGYDNLQDQIGSFLGGIDDYFEGRYNGLTITGRQKIAERFRPELIKIGYHMQRAKPADIRAILEHPLVARIDGEELGKFFRFAIEMAKIDEYLKGTYVKRSLETLKDYKIALALEQDASASGAQVIALTTRNKQLAEFSNVIPTTSKKRIYDEVARDTFNDPRFQRMNERLGLTEKELRKASKYQVMVSLYGAGERTGILQVEKNLAKALGKQVTDNNLLIISTTDRDTVLSEISARIARYEKFNPEVAAELQLLRKQVKDVFDKGLTVNDGIMDELYFLDAATREVVEKMTRTYDKVITPQDFKQIANIMSEYMAESVPVLKSFTRFFGRLAEDFLKNAKPSKSDFDWKTILKTLIRGSKKKGYVLPDALNILLGVKPGEPVSEAFLSRFGFWKPNGTLSELIYGIEAPETRKTGAKFLKVEVKVPSVDLKKATFGKSVKLFEVELFKANKLPKSWTNVPSVNFDGKIIEQNFTQVFEEKLLYKDKFGNWTTNILQVAQKTEADWWDQAVNAKGKINDIADATRARTAYGVNSNHSNDATIVKNFHLWGKKRDIMTSTVNKNAVVKLG
jgi:SPP1 gp7 family putative phage head morphogenesis protein